MFKKFIEKITLQVRQELIQNNEKVTAEVLRQYQSRLEDQLALAKRLADERQARLDTEYAEKCRAYDKLVNEVQRLAAIADERKKELTFQNERMEAEITAMRAGSPDRLFQEAFRAGHEKGFDLALALQQERFVAYVEKKIEEIKEKERARYEQAIAKFESAHPAAARPTAGSPAAS